MTWSFVQYTSAGSSNSSSTRHLSYTSNVTAGDLLITAVSIGSGLTATVTDSQGNSYSQAGSYADNGSSRCGLFWAIAGSSGACQVNVAPSGTTYMGIAIHEYTPPAGTVSVDGTNNANSAGGSTTPSCGSIPVSGSNEMALAAMAASGASYTISAGSGWTLRSSQNGSNTLACGTEEQLNISSAVTGSFSLSSSHGWAAVGASWKVSGGSSAGPLRNVIVLAPLSPAVLE